MGTWLQTKPRRKTRCCHEPARAGHDSSFHVRSVDTFKNVAVERRLFGSVLRYVNPFEAASEWDADSEEGLPNSPDARFVT